MKGELWYWQNLCSWGWRWVQMHASWMPRWEWSCTQT